MNKWRPFVAAYGQAVSTGRTVVLINLHTTYKTNDDFNTTQEPPSLNGEKKAITHEVEDSFILFLKSAVLTVIVRRNAEPPRLPTKRTMARNNSNRVMYGLPIKRY